jgi:TonB family protein
MRHVCEICCDLSAANFLRERTAAYRDTLIKTARELFSENLEPKLGLFGIFEEPFRLLPRLRWLEKKTWENRKGKSAATLFVSLIMITCVLPMSGLSESAPQSVEKVYEIDEVDEPPRVLQAFPPRFPDVALEENIQGRVVIEFVVTKDGITTDEWVFESEPPDVFDETALEAISQYRFSPGTINGEAVDVRVKMPIAFSLDGPNGQGVRLRVSVEQSDSPVQKELDSQIYQLDPESSGSPGQIYNLDEVNAPPRIIRAFPPRYPYNAKINKIEGRVLVRFVVDTDGKAREPEVVEAEPKSVFEQSALDALLQYEFEPATMNGMPVLCIVKMPIEFRMGEE